MTAIVIPPITPERCLHRAEFCWRIYCQTGGDLVHRASWFWLMRWAVMTAPKGESE